MDTAYSYWIRLGALVALVGFIASGPLAIAVISMVAPQPLWESAETFAQHYHPVQQLPYAFGMVLLAGWLILMSGHWLGYRHVTTGQRVALLTGLLLTGIFTALIFFNYITQLVFVHQMATQFKADYVILLPAFTMVNPASLSWTLEMWGYALLGVVTWLMRPVYRDHRLLRWLLPLNCLGSLTSAVWVIIDSAWVQQPIGMLLYALWNVLMVLILLCLYYHHRNGVQTNAKLIA